MKIQNNKIKITTTIISALLIGFGLISPTTMIPNVGATPVDTRPPMATKWLDTHPNFIGCVSGNLKTGVMHEIPCANPNITHPGPKPTVASKQVILPQSYNNPQKIDCSSHCWAGGVFSSTGPYKQETGNTNIPSSSPSISPTSFSYWSGLTDNSLLVQSGWWYQSALSSGSPYMFAEIYGNFVYNLVNCSTSFCGSAMVESANDAIYTTNYADVGNSQWVAYVQDNTSFDYTMFTVPFSTSGASNSLADAVYSLEGQSTPSTSYFPPSPINFTSITLYAPGSGQVNANTNSMSSYDDPLSSTGIPIDVQATGTTTAEIGISW